MPLRLTFVDADGMAVASADSAVTSRRCRRSAMPRPPLIRSTMSRPSGAPAPSPSFSTFWEFARAVNRSDPAALRLAGNGAACDIPMDGQELKKLLGTFWFRSVFPRLSPEWQDRMLNVLVEHVTIPDHAVRNGRRTLHLHEMTQDQRQRMVTEPGLPDAIRTDLQLLITVARLWGEEAVNRFEFTPVPETADNSRMAFLLQPFRHS